MDSWSCTTPSGTCAAVTTNVTGQNDNALASDNIIINVGTNAHQVQVCAQRQIQLFTAFPGLQNLHISTTSSFYIPLTGTSSTRAGLCTDPPCVYQSTPEVNCG